MTAIGSFFAHDERVQIYRPAQPSSSMHGGQDEGRKAVQRLLQERLYYYSERRNDPLQAGTSEISPFLIGLKLNVSGLALDFSPSDDNAYSSRYR